MMDTKLEKSLLAKVSFLLSLFLFHRRLYMGSKVDWTRT